MSSEIAIEIKQLSKCYPIYAQPRDRLKQFVLPRLKRLLGFPPKQYFREFWALRDISLTVNKGETVGIIGRNGSGKSTLLQMVCNTLNPTCGSIQTHGRIAALLELGSGFNPEFTGRENVYMNATVLGLEQDAIDQRFDDIVAFADIGEFIEQPVKTYSSGMLVRLAFAVIAHVDADILVIDEALSVGDAFFTQKCMRFLRCFMETGTVLFVSHDASAVLGLCDRAVLLKAGRIERMGAAKEVVEHYLESLYETAPGITKTVTEKKNTAPPPREEEYRDPREPLINASNLRNDIQVFQFSDHDDGFGTGCARISSVKIMDHHGHALSWLTGGEDVVLEIRALANQEIIRPIVGFQFKDRLGQVIFADNSFLTYELTPVRLMPGREIVAKFSFRHPVLLSGDYSIDAAIAEGTQENHVQHHWLRNALIVKAHASPICLGLVGIPMKKITLETQ